MRRGPGIAASALTTSGTLPKGSITRISRMVAESSSDCIVSAVFAKDAEVYRLSQAKQSARTAQHEAIEKRAARRYESQCSFTRGSTRGRGKRRTVAKATRT